LQIDYYEKQLHVSPHQSLFKSRGLIDASLKAFKCKTVLFFEGQQVFISKKKKGGQYSGFRVLVAILTTSAASSAGAERLLFDEHH